MKVSSNNANMGVVNMKRLLRALIRKTQKFKILKRDIKKEKIGSVYCSPNYMMRVRKWLILNAFLNMKIAMKHLLKVRVNTKKENLEQLLL